MKTPRLHEYDLALCDYVRGNFAGLTLSRDPALDHRPRTPSTKQSDPNPRNASRHQSKRKKAVERKPRSDPFKALREDYKNLPEPDRVARWFFRQMPPRLWDYVVSDDKFILLTEDDFDSLELASTVEHSLVPKLSLLWSPWPGLHKRYIHCVAEIRHRIAPSTAEDFAKDSIRFISELEKPGLTLCAGTRLVRDWTRAIRRNLRAMGEDNCLPLPEGLSPTPASPGDGAPPELRSYISELRKAFRQRPDLKTMSTNKVLRAVTGNRDLNLQSLRFLKSKGEYPGRQK